MNRQEAHEAVLRLAAGVRSEPDPAGRLLERVAAADAPELGAVLVELGAQAALAAARRAEP